MLFTLLFLIISQSYASILESPLYYSQDESSISKRRFEEIINLFSREFSSFAQKDQRDLEFLTDYKDNWAQAFARRWETDQVIVYGGLSRIKDGTEDSFALALCHELGHLYGGTPYQDEHNRLSAEGQADYWATSVCWPKAAIFFSPLNIEARGIQAALIFTSFFAANRHLPAPTLNTPDLTIQDRVLYEHPTPQCRLDTYLAGLKDKPRPLCWFHTL